MSMLLSARARRSVAAGALATAVLCVGGYEAQAAPAPAPVTDSSAVAAVNSAAAREGEPAASGLQADGATVAQSGPARLTLSAPNNLQLTVTARGTQGSRVVSGAAVADAPGGAKIVSQAVEEQTGRQSVTIPSAGAPTSMAYDVNLPTGAHFDQRQDGSIAIVASNQGADVELGVVDAPYARDAAGADVPTRLTASGSTITQTVTPAASAQYPIVADPKITFGRTIYLNLTGGEANAARAAGLAAAGAGILAGCTTPFKTFIATIPVVGSIVAGLVTLACTYGAKDSIQAIFDELTSNPVPFDVGSCYQTDLLNVGQFKKVGNQNCGN